MAYKIFSQNRLFHKILIVIACSLLCVGCSEDVDPLMASYKAKKGSYQIRTRHLNEQNEPLYTNRLIQQDSPYLLQHAHNPVDWWSWGDEAFAAAEAQDKPILLSVGYSTCHWCHVMERESFEDLAIATFINENFIPVKVDREERPDVDEVYMTAAQLLSGKTGWPLTVVMTPDGKPFFGGTYFAPEQFQKLLTQISKTWSERRAAVVEQANRVTGEMAKINQSSASSKKISNKVIAQAEQRIIRSFKQPPQSSGAAFPREPEMMFLIYRSYLTLQPAPLQVVENRLLELAAGGLHDQLGGGFHRYSVDPQWRVPHFEKMLYNQAQMGQLYANAYLMGGNQTLKGLAASTLDFILSTMQAPEGGFYAALDAESDGREGAYYIWSMQELRNILDVTELQVARAVFGVSDSGKFNGENVLYNNQLDSSNVDDSISDAQIEDLKQKLFAVQKKRPAPLTDKKIITAWNSMAVSALISGFQATGNRQYLEAAERAVRRLWEKAYDSKRGLARTLPSNTVWIDGTLEDYAYYSNALIDMYDLTEDRQWLVRAEAVITSMIERFHDSKTGGFRITSASGDKNVVMGLVTARDDAIVSGNSMAAIVLARAYRRTGKTELKQRATDIHAAFAKQAITNPESLSGMLMSIGVLRDGEIGMPQFGARGKVKVSASLTNQELAIDIDIQPGWHINAHKVLEKELIPTALNREESFCDTIDSVTYPSGKRVKLGFQKDELLLYEGKVDISATLSKHSDRQCRLVGAKLRVQACSDEVCQAPETLPIRLSYKDAAR